jgi:RNA polymerase sigma factor (sigma-70 family)
VTDARNEPWPTAHETGAPLGGVRGPPPTLLDGSHAHVRRFARTLCSTPEDAEEATQEALIVLYRKIGTLRTAAALASWMFQIVRHECIRRTRLSLHRSLPAERIEPSAEDAALVRMEMQRIVDCVARLPTDQRAVLVLRDIHGLSGGATAQALGLSRAAMKSRLHRGRTTLHSWLETTAGATGDGASSDD